MKPRNALVIFLLPFCSAITLPGQRTSTWAPIQRTVRYELRVINTRDKSATNIHVHLPLPWENARQEVKYLHLSEPGKLDTFTDRHGQRLVRYHIDQLAPHTCFEIGFTIGLTLQHARWHHPDKPDLAGGPQLTGKTRSLYLQPRKNYSMDSPAMKAKAIELATGAKTQFDKLQRIHDFIVSHVKYVRDTKWDPAAVILKRGTGSCSEYNYLLSGLCRLANLPTRYVGGSSSHLAPLPESDTVFHRWTEVFLDGVGWYPVDCSRDANPLRGKRSHFGRLYHDALVWCRQAGGGQDLLGWEYRAKTRVKGENPGIHCNHRTRWLEYVPQDKFKAARNWLRNGAKAKAPDANAMQAALLDWQRTTANAKLRLIHAMAAAGRNPALRRAASLTLPQPKKEALFKQLTADAGLYQALCKKSLNLWDLRKWFRSNEKKIIPAAAGRFSFKPQKPTPASPKTWTGLGKAVATAITARLDRSTTRVVLMTPDDRTRGKAPLAKIKQAMTRTLAASFRVINPETFTNELEKTGIGRGEYWLYAMDRNSRVPVEISPQCRPDAILIPIISTRKNKKRIQVKILVVKNCQYLKVTR